MSSELTHERCLLQDIVLSNEGGADAELAESHFREAVPERPAFGAHAVAHCVRCGTDIRVYRDGVIFSEREDAQSVCLEGLDAREEPWNGLSIVYDGFDELSLLQ